VAAVIGPNSDEPTKSLPSAELNVRIHSPPAESQQRTVLALLTLSVDPALPYSLIRVADAEDHRDQGRSSRARAWGQCTGSGGMSCPIGSVTHRQTTPPL
jgi:hypothetical protein